MFTIPVTYTMWAGYFLQYIFQTTAEKEEKNIPVYL